MLSCLCVGLGGAIGAMLRYVIGLIDLGEKTEFPYKTLIINVLGSFAIGLIVAWAVRNSTYHPNLILFLKVGICGGFTTFSTFALESTTLFQNGKPGLAILYMALSVLLSITAVFAAEAIIN